jgi:hypothetical protein
VNFRDFLTSGFVLEEMVFFPDTSMKFPVD